MYVLVTDDALKASRTAARLFVFSNFTNDPHNALDKEHGKDYVVRLEPST